MSLGPAPVLLLSVQQSALGYLVEVGRKPARMGATHFKMKTLRHVATEMALHVLAYNIKRVIASLGVPGLLQAK